MVQPGYRPLSCRRTEPPIAFVAIARSIILAVVSSSGSLQARSGSRENARFRRQQQGRSRLFADQPVEIVTLVRLPGGKGKRFVQMAGCGGLLLGLHQTVEPAASPRGVLIAVLFRAEIRVEPRSDERYVFSTVKTAHATARYPTPL